MAQYLQLFQLVPQDKRVIVLISFKKACLVRGLHPHLGLEPCKMNAHTQLER